MGRETTTRPVAEGDLSALEPEFARVPDIERIFGLKRSTVYNLLSEGKIKGVLMRCTGNKSGIRLISVASVRKYIQSCCQEVVA